jgi:small subunit ribosomal protein S2
MSQPLPMFNIRELLDAGVHFGHKTMRWNPKMAPYLFGIRNGIHVIDLQQTVPMLYRALKVVQDVAAKNGRVLFVGTKRQASDLIADAAKRSGQYYVNHRWLGGMLTNWNTVSASIKTLKQLDEQLSTTHTNAEGEEESSVYTKKELLQMTRERDKLERSLGGIKDMPKQPDLIFVIDTVKEELALQEAAKLGIPVVAIVDSNSNPDGIAYPIPGNDDATRAIALYCQLISDAVLSGISESLNASGVDLGAQSDLPNEAANDSAPQDKQLARGKNRVSKNAAASEAEIAVNEKRARTTSKAPAKKADVVVEKKPARKATTKE